MIDNKSVFMPTRRIAFRRIGDQVVLVSPDENVMLTLNASGSKVWECLDGKSSVEEIVTALEQEFEVSTERARKDVFGFLGQLIERALVERVAVDRET